MGRSFGSLHRNVWVVAMMGMSWESTFGELDVKTCWNEKCESAPPTPQTQTSGSSMMQQKLDRSSSRQKKGETEKTVAADLFEIGEEPIQAFEIVFPATSIDTGSLLQSDTPLALLAASARHVFTVILDEDPSLTEVENGEYKATGVRFTTAPGSSPVQTGYMYPLGAGEELRTCSSKMWVCNGVLLFAEEHSMIETACVCKVDGTVPKKTIKVTMRNGLNLDELDAAITQVAMLADKESDQTLLMVDMQHVHAIESKRQQMKTKKGQVASYSYWGYRYGY